MFLIPIIVIWCGGKKWLFWFYSRIICFYGVRECFAFAKGRLVCRAKPNVPFAGWHRISKYFVRWGKKIKHEALGCRVGKKSAVKFICRPVVSIIVCSFNGCCVVCYACL
jgi:hypothetical protein